MFNFNLWPKNNTKEIIDNIPAWEWKPTQTPSMLQAQNDIIDNLIKENNKLRDENEKLQTYSKNLREQQEFLYNENKNLNDLLKSIEEDGTEEHNKAVELRQENTQLRSKLDEFVKEVLDLRHLKRENVDLIESLQKEVAKNKVLLDNNNRMLKKEGNSYGITFNEAKTQIIQNDYKKCAQERDEYKHQLNAANKEIEALKRWKDDQLVVMKQWDEVDQYIRNHKDTKLGEFIAGTCLHFLKERDEYGCQIRADYKEIEHLRNGIRVICKKRDELKETLKLREQEIVDYVTEKDDIVNALKDKIRQQEVAIERWHSRSNCWDKIEEEKRTEKYYVCNHCGYKVAHNTNQWGGCGCCKDGLMIEREEVVDYSEETWKCPCNICKERKTSKLTSTWEEVASDLALRVVKLEKKVEELTLNKIPSDPNYEYFKKHDKWPWGIPYSAMNPDGTLKTINCSTTEPYKNWDKPTQEYDNL